MLLCMFSPTSARLLEIICFETLIHSFIFHQGWNQTKIVIPYWTFFIIFFLRNLILLLDSRGASSHNLPPNKFKKISIKNIWPLVWPISHPSAVKVRVKRRSHGSRLEGVALKRVQWLPQPVQVWTKWSHVLVIRFSLALHYKGL